MSKKSRRESLRESLSEAVRPHEPSPKLDEILGRYAPANPILSQSPQALPNDRAQNEETLARTSTLPSTGTSTPPSTSSRGGSVGASDSPSPHEVAPRRDFHKVANSITRQALPAGMFSGKSKQLYDCLYSLSRGAIVPSMTVRIAKSDLMEKANIGSKVTLDQNLRRLEAVGLLTVETIGGIQGGNQYTVYLPEEVATSASTGTSTPPSTGTSSPTPPSPPSRGQNLGALAPLETTPPSPGVSVDCFGTSGEPKTSFKTKDEKLDDEAFAGLIALLKQATGEVTGKEPLAAEQDRWTEVGELLVAELRQGATRTTVSSVPAFLAEHLRRRLSRQPAPQPGPKAPAIVPAVPAPALEPPTDDELVEMFTGFLHQGMTPEDLDGQLSASIDAERWPRIRAAALESYERERGQMRPPDKP